MQRYFINKNQISDDLVIISGGDFHHIKHVMRNKTGDQVIVNTKEGQVYLSEIICIGKESVSLKIVETINAKRNHINLDLGLSLTKKDSFELALKKATELGVSRIIPLQTDRSIIKVKDFDKKRERYLSICKESSEQSERITLPRIDDLKKLDSLDLAAYDHLFLAYAREDKQSIKKELSQIKADEHTLVLVGPEGGFSESEIKFLLNKGFKTISLGKTILRAETAALYITSIFRYTLED